MKLPCAVTRDLLPLYAEELVEQETQALIEEGQSFPNSKPKQARPSKRQSRFNR